MNPDQFLLFASLLPEPMLLLAADGTVLAANPAAVDGLGRPASALTGRRFADLFADSPDEVAEFLAACRGNGSLHAGTLFLRGEDGAAVAWRAEGTSARRDGAAQSALLLRLMPAHAKAEATLSTDSRIADLDSEILRRKQAEDVARQQIERLRVTLSSIGDGVIVSDTAFRVVSLNPIAESLTGWSEQEALGRPLEEIFRIVNETTREVVPNPAVRAIREGVAVELAENTILIARDGTERPIVDSAAPIREGHVSPVGAVLVFRDYSRQKEIEAASKRLAAIVTSSDDAIVGKTLQGIVTSWNKGAERVFGYTAEEMIGRPILTLIPPDHADEEAEIIRRITRGEKVHHYDTLRQRKDGTLIPISVTVSPIFDRHGKVVGASKIARDISERKQLETKLQEYVAEMAAADRRKDEFLALLAHELRNPLAPIRSGLQVLRLAGNDPAAAEKAREVMERQLTQMVRLVDDLMEVSRISQNKIELRKERLDLAGAVQTALEACDTSIRQQGHALTVQLSDEPILVDADPTRLAQALCNLLNNASKYTERGGSIRVAAERRGDEAVISVRDTGIGIPPGMLGRVFDMFTQVDQSLEKSQGGLGIGLTISKRLIEMHGGTIEAHSEGEGLGSEFVVRIPVAGSPWNAASAKRAGARTPAAGHRILVVDDNVDAANSLAMLLRIMGNEVWTAHDGVDGVSAAASFRPDLVLMDIGMPRLNGYDACRHLREQPWSNGLVVVALTGWGQDTDKSRSQEAGFDHHLVKPVEHAALESLLATLAPSCA